MINYIAYAWLQLNIIICLFLRRARSKLVEWDTSPLQASTPQHSVMLPSKTTLIQLYTWVETGAVREECLPYNENR